MTIKRSFYGMLSLALLLCLVLISCNQMDQSSYSDMSGRPGDSGDSGTAKYGTARYDIDKYN